MARNDSDSDSYDSNFSDSDDFLLKSRMKSRMNLFQDDNDGELLCNFNNNPLNRRRGSRMFSFVGAIAAPETVPPPLAEGVEGEGEDEVEDEADRFLTVGKKKAKVAAKEREQLASDSSGRFFRNPILGLFNNEVGHNESTTPVAAAANDPKDNLERVDEDSEDASLSSEKEDLSPTPVQPPTQDQAPQSTTSSKENDESNNARAQSLRNHGKQRSSRKSGFRWKWGKDQSNTDLNNSSHHGSSTLTNSTNSSSPHPPVPDGPPEPSIGERSGSYSDSKCDNDDWSSSRASRRPNFLLDIFGRKESVNDGKTPMGTTITARSNVNSIPEGGLEGIVTAGSQDMSAGYADDAPPPAGEGETPVPGRRNFLVNIFGQKGDVSEQGEGDNILPPSPMKPETDTTHDADNINTNDSMEEEEEEKDVPPLPPNPPPSHPPPPPPTDSSPSGKKPKRKNSNLNLFGLLENDQTVPKPRMPPEHYRESQRCLFSEIDISHGHDEDSAPKDNDEDSLSIIGWNNTKDEDGVDDEDGDDEDGGDLLITFAPRRRPSFMAQSQIPSSQTAKKMSASAGTLQIGDFYGAETEEEEHDEANEKKKLMDMELSLHARSEDITLLLRQESKFFSDDEEDNDDNFALESGGGHVGLLIPMEEDELHNNVPMGVGPLLPLPPETIPSHRGPLVPLSEEDEPSDDESKVSTFHRRRNSNASQRSRSFGSSSQNENEGLLRKESIPEGHTPALKKTVSGPVGGAAERQGFGFFSMFQRPSQRVSASARHVREHEEAGLLNRSYHASVPKNQSNVEDIQTRSLPTLPEFHHDATIGSKGIGHKVNQFLEQHQVLDGPEGEDNKGFYRTLRGGIDDDDSVRGTDDLLDKLDDAEEEIEGLEQDLEYWKSEASKYKMLLSEKDKEIGELKAFYTKKMEELEDELERTKRKLPKSYKDDLGAVDPAVNSLLDLSVATVGTVDGLASVRSPPPAAADLIGVLGDDFGSSKKETNLLDFEESETNETNLLDFQSPPLPQKESNSDAFLLENLTRPSLTESKHMSLYNFDPFNTATETTSPATIKPDLQKSHSLRNFDPMGDNSTPGVSALTSLFDQSSSITLEPKYDPSSQRSTSAGTVCDSKPDPFKSLIEEEGCPFVPRQKFSELTADQVMRYSRQLLVKGGFGVEGQKKLMNAKVLVIGAGGIGSTALLYLAAAGVNLTIVDFDTVHISNLHRQIIHTNPSSSSTPLNKSHSAKMTIQNLNPTVSVTTVTEPLSSQNARQLVSQHDVVLDACDNPRTRYLVNDACVLEHKVLVSGSAMGGEGQLTVYNEREGGCYRCLYPKGDRREGCKSCADNGVLGPVPGLIGILTAMEVIKVLTGMGSTMNDRLLMYDAFNCTFLNVKKPKKRPTCTVCGHNPTITSMSESHYQSDRGPSLPSATPIPNNNDIPSVSPSQYHKIKETQDHLLLDVRVTEQYDICSLDNAVNIPLEELESRMEEVKELAQKRRHKDNGDSLENTHTLYNPVYCICRRGIASAAATKLLMDVLGEDVTVMNIGGGLDAWVKEVDEHFPMY